MTHLVTHEVIPGAERQSCDESSAATRAMSRTVYHLGCGCRMGRDAGAVVDSALKVNGLHDVCIVDASVLAKVTSANTKRQHR